MKRLIVAGALAGAGVLLGSCATMSQDQCLAGAWDEVGFADGAEGYAMSRLNEHAEACAKYGVAPDEAAYSAARFDGLRTYCTAERGFREGREGDSYGGVCSPAQEAMFLPAYRDGQVVREAEQAAASARSSVDSLGGRLEELDDKLEAKDRELRQDGLSDDQKETVRNRIRELRREREQTERRWRDARRDVDEAEREARRVRLYYVGVYGSW